MRGIADLHDIVHAPERSVARAADVPDAATLIGASDRYHAEVNEKTQPPPPPAPPPPPDEQPDPDDEIVRRKRQRRVASGDRLTSQATILSDNAPSRSGQRLGG